MKKKILFIVFVLGLYLSINNVYAYDKYKFGDQITFSGELYHVIENSDENQDYITILKDEPLTIQNLYKYGRDENDHLFVNEYVSNFDDLEKVVYEYGDKYGGMAYYTSETCSSNLYWSISNFNHSDIEIVGCNNSYTKSDVKKVIDNWSKSFSGNLKEVDGYKARILTYDDLVNKLGFVSLNGDSDYRINLDTNISWFTNFNYPIWISNTLNDSNKVLIIFGTNGTNEGRQWLYDPNDFFATVRPVLNVYKSKIGNEEYQNSEEPNEENIDNTSDEEQNTTYKEYKKGDLVIYKDTLFYVVNDSDDKQNYVYLVRAMNLSNKQIKNYSRDFSIKNNLISYYSNSECRYMNFNSQCSSSYNNSNVKRVVDNYVKNELNENDLVEVNGYKAKILSYEEVFGLINQYPFEIHSNVLDYKLKYLFGPEYGYNGYYWLMKNDISDGYNNYVFFTEILDKDEFSYLYTAWVKQEAEVRPTIYLKKSAIEKKEIVSSKKYKSYKIGDLVSYNGDSYYVIKNSDEHDNSLTLLKENALTFDEVKKYKGDLTVDVTDKNGVGLIPYYENETCNRNVEYDKVYDCNGNYDASFIKKVVDNWTKDRLNDEDLILEDKYKTRVLKFNDLAYYLGYDIYNLVTDYLLKKTNDVPNWVYSDNYNICTMSTYYDTPNIYNIYPNGDVTMGKGEYGGYTVGLSNVYNICAVRPVINVDKCAIQKDCDVVDETIKPDIDDKIDEEPIIDDVKEEPIKNVTENEVIVANTLKNVSKIILFVSVILIIGGLSFLIYNYYISKKDQK